MMIVHILRMYNSKHPYTWDESLHYVQNSYSWALHSSTGYNPCRWAWNSIHYVPLTQPCHLWLLRLIQLISSLKMTKRTTSSSAFNTSSNRFMTYWTEPMLSTRNYMIIIGCHTTSRWAIKCGYICRRMLCNQLQKQNKRDINALEISHFEGATSNTLHE